MKFGTTNAVLKENDCGAGVGFGGDLVSRENECLRERPELLALEAVVVFEPVDDWEVLFVRREALPLVLGRVDVGVLFPPPNMAPFLEKMPPLASSGKNASRDRSILLGLCLDRGGVGVCLAQSRWALALPGVVIGPLFFPNRCFCAPPESHNHRRVVEHVLRIVLHIATGGPLFTV